MSCPSDFVFQRALIGVEAAKGASPFSLAGLLRAASLTDETRLGQAANADALRFLGGEITADELRAGQVARAAGGSIPLAMGGCSYPDAAPAAAWSSHR